LKFFWCKAFWEGSCYNYNIVFNYYYALKGTTTSFWFELQHTRSVAKMADQVSQPKTTNPGQRSSLRYMCSTDVFQTKTLRWTKLERRLKFASFEHLSDATLPLSTHNNSHVQRHDKGTNKNATHQWMKSSLVYVSNGMLQGLHTTVNIKAQFWRFFLEQTYHNKTTTVQCFWWALCRSARLLRTRLGSGTSSTQQSLAR